MKEEHRETIQRIGEWLAGDPNELPLRKAAIKQLNAFLGFERATTAIESGHAARYIHLMETYNGEKTVTEKLTIDALVSGLKTAGNTYVAAKQDAISSYQDVTSKLLAQALESDIDIQILLAIVLADSARVQSQAAVMPEMDMSELLNAVKRRFPKAELKPDWREVFKDRQTGKTSEADAPAEAPRKVEINKNMAAPYGGSPAAPTTDPYIAAMVGATFATSLDDGPNAAEISERNADINYRGSSPIDAPAPACEPASSPSPSAEPSSSSDTSSSFSE